MLSPADLSYLCRTELRHEKTGKKSNFLPVFRKAPRADLRSNVLIAGNVDKLHRIMQSESKTEKKIVYMRENLRKIGMGTLLILGLGACMGSAQQQQGRQHYEWSTERMDSKWDPEVKSNGKIKGGSKTHEIIARYKPSVDRLTEPIGKTDAEIAKGYPESPLSNFAADVILETARAYSGEQVDMAITNFGGLRTSFPAGDITMYDVLSIFPFDNYIVIVDLKGKDIREMMENFAKRNTIEAVSGVKVVIDKGVLKELKVGGEPVNDGKTYKVATIDFLMSGGDHIYALKRGTNMVKTGIVLHQAVSDYIKALTAAGKKVNPQKDGRVVFIRPDKKDEKKKK